MEEEVKSHFLKVSFGLLEVEMSKFLAEELMSRLLIFCSQP